MRSPAKFITFEGGEGAGKSTQAKRLTDWLRAQGVAVLLTREPGGSAKAEVLRELLLAGHVTPFGAEAEALVFAIARADHLAETIRPALAAGTWVICDRFLDSTWAYQGAAGVTAEALARLDEIAVGADRPDLTLVLDLPPEIGSRRLRDRGARLDRFERDPLQLQEARREAFLRIAAREPERCLVVDAAGDEAKIAETVRAAVVARLAPALAGAA